MTHNHLFIDRRGSPESFGEAALQTLVISGGRAGVGATTLAVHLAAALASEAHRVVLIDADLHQADLSGRLGLSGGPTIADVLTGRKSIHEALQRGPSGMHVLAGSATAAARSGASGRALERLHRQMHSLAPHADWLVVDAGNRASPMMASLWAGADRVLLVTSPDAAAVMDSYALVKTLLSRHRPGGPVELVVNQLEGLADAADVQRRIDRSCQRFLGVMVGLAGAIRWCASTGSGQGLLPPLIPSRADGLLVADVARLSREIAQRKHWLPSQQRRAA